MQKLASTFTGFNYYCPECNQKAYSPVNNLCYCCNLKYEDAIEYTNCIVCNENESIIFDPLNIAINNHVLNGLCLQCDTKVLVHKCPKCKNTYSFFEKEELTKCTPEKCYYVD